MLFQEFDVFVDADVGVGVGVVDAEVLLADGLHEGEAVGEALEEAGR
jgi:hypothetical protein